MTHKEHHDEGCRHGPPNLDPKVIPAIRFSIVVGDPGCEPCSKGRHLPHIGPPPGHQARRVKDFVGRLHNQPAQFSIEGVDVTVFDGLLHHAAHPVTMTDRWHVGLVDAIGLAVVVREAPAPRGLAAKDVVPGPQRDDGLDWRLRDGHHDLFNGLVRIMRLRYRQRDRLLPRLYCSDRWGNLWCCRRGSASTIALLPT